MSIFFYKTNKCIAIINFNFKNFFMFRVDVLRIWIEFDVKDWTVFLKFLFNKKKIYIYMYIGGWGGQNATRWVTWTTSKIFFFQNFSSRHLLLSPFSYNFECPNFWQKFPMNSVYCWPQKIYGVFGIFKFYKNYLS